MNDPFDTSDELPDLTEAERQFFDYIPVKDDGWRPTVYGQRPELAAMAKAPSSQSFNGLLSDAAKPANPKQAYGNKKLPVHLVPPALVLGAAKALGEGAVKYGAYNWRETRVEATTYSGAILRHLYAWMDGEDVDPESTTGKLHLEGIAACVAILLDTIYAGTLIDNRPPAGPAPRLVLTPKETK